MVVFIITSALIGLTAGFLSGQFGIGGGIITKPAIRLVLEQKSMIAIGTPLPIIVPTALFSFYNYSRNNLADRRSAFIIGLAGAIISIPGAYLTNFVSGPFLLLITAALILLISLRFLWPKERKIQSILPENYIYLATLGFIAGFFSGFLGLGGGFIIVPALAILFGKNIKVAFGTSLLAIVFMAIPGSIVHFVLGNVDLSIAFYILLGIIPGALIGSKLTIALPERIVNVLFGIFLLLTAIYLAFNEIMSIGA